MDDMESGWCRCANARRNLAALFGSEAGRLAVLVSWPDCRSLRGVGHGEAIFGPAIARRMVDFFAVPRSGTPPHAFPQLSQREREVLGFIAQGINNAAIADRLCLSPKTVRNHISNIFSKLQVADRAEAIVRAREAGLS